MPYGDDGTVPLDPLYRELISRYGRRFQGFSLRNRVYCVPVDTTEYERLVVQHEVIQEFFDNRYFFGRDNAPRKVLDCGYGRAQWANGVAELYPDCEVTGIDIYPRDPDDYAENLELLCDDLNKSLLPILDPNSFDVINSQFVEAGLDKRRWPSYIRDLARLLKPGGSLQLMEYCLDFRSQVHRASALYAWSENYQIATETDREPNVGQHAGAWMERAGLVDVHTRFYALPIGGWGNNAREVAIGTHNLSNFDRLLDSFALYAFNHRLGMTREQILDLTRVCRDEVRDPNLRPFIPLYVCWARKPLR